jgi:hypothetical protein
MTDNLNLTPAALGALAKGDLANAVAAMTPGGIEAQESAGQRALTSNFLTLPIDMDRQAGEAFGFVYGDAEDDLFVQVTPPEGWNLRASDHAMWSYVHDAQGVQRASIFYKAAFYDRRAGGHWDARYAVEREHGDDHVYTAFKAVDRATGETLFREELSDGEGSDYSVYSLVDQRISDLLTERFPDWRNPVAYWSRDTDRSGEADETAKQAQP